MRCAGACAPGRRPHTAERRARAFSTSTSGYVERRWVEGCRNSAHLWRELREPRGFEGGYDVVRRWAIRYRTLLAAGSEPMHRLPSWRVPSSRRAARLLTTEATSLSRADQRFVRTLIALSPDIRDAVDLVNGFTCLVREHDADALDPHAIVTVLGQFAVRLLRFYCAGCATTVTGVVWAALSAP